MPFRPDWPQWVRLTVLGAGEDAVAAPFRASLLHGDLSRHNITARRGDQGWEVAGVST